MRCATILLLGLLATGRLEAQQLDSGTVVRFHWRDGSEKARLLAPLRPDAPLVHYCRYPSPVCGPATVNPPLARPASDLVRIDRRDGSRAGRGALIGLGFGTAGGLLVLWSQGLGDGSRLTGTERAAGLAIIAGTWSAIGALIGAMSDGWTPVP